MNRALPLALVALLSLAPVAQAQIALPTDVAPSCTVSQCEFASWFVGGTVTPGGVVTPANGIVFPPTSNTACDFYKWSSHMFLWLTSPTQNTLILDSPIVFDVSAPNSQGQRAFMANTGNGEAKGNKFALRDEKPIGVDSTGQAGGNAVLISQKGSLVYYGVHANDVFAWFLTGQKSGQIPVMTFPMNAPEIAAVALYAGAKGKTTLLDLQAMTMEMKSSWVDATTVDATQFITIMAEVPNYVKTSATQWTPYGTIQKKLALVGLHVVGTVNGHPEMVWATFEHVSNAPNNGYYYNPTTGGVANVPYNSAGNWTFMQSGGSQTGANTELMNVDTNGNIVAKGANPIGPSNTFRVNPWGSAGNTSSSADNNTDILSLNVDVLSQLANQDVRRNYVLVGALWTADGSIPTDGSSTAMRGSLELANTTMETYHQDMNCFACHKVPSGSSSFDAGALSHIYSQLQPLQLQKPPVPSK
ncbi:hypothetical protein POL68_20110 [Stigmatella sp. ncwal1]|uniref:Cytochrome c family protein n=1 Tax=Stigmatella ashevillensis TaxID=2995309 RepID=A0ABT5DEP3_9BACT|nr:hypothetical protein [Stigmatella ashevillena]MDC0710792.1 hypothetical protein [Stigmatella ashevillena]